MNQYLIFFCHKNVQLESKKILFKESNKEAEEAALAMWNEVNETLVELDAFRRNYATKSAKLIGDLKENTMDSIDAYFSESQTVYEWASVVQPLLKAIINIGKSEGVKKALTTVLDTGLTKLNAAQTKLQKSSDTFNALASDLKELNSQFDIDFDEKSIYFENKLKEMRAAHKDDKKGAFEKDLVPLLSAKMEAIKKFHGDLTDRINDAFRSIDTTKAKLHDEIEHIDTLKSKIDPIKTSLNSDSESNDDSKKSVQDLITEAEKYRERHNKKNNLN